MKKTLIIIYSVLSFIGFACILFFTGYLIFKSYEKNSMEREKEFISLNDQAVSWFSEAKSLKSELFDKKVEKAIKENTQLIVFLIYSKNDGILYFKEKKPKNILTYLKSFGKDSAGKENAIWMGKPDYVNLPLGVKIFSLRFVETVKGPLYFDGVYWPVDVSEISQYIKWSFFILFVWLILSFIVRLFVSTKSMQEIYEMGYGYGANEAEIPKQPETGNMTGNSFDDSLKKNEKVETESRGENFHEVKKDSSISLFSPNTGLGWQDHLEERLKLEINRSASFNQDMVFAFILIDDFSLLNNSFSVYKSIAKIILNSFPFQDLAFEYEKDGYAVMIPDSEINQGIKSFELFQRKIAKTDFNDKSVTVSIGLSSRNGRLLSAQILMQEAAKALEKAHQEGKNRIFAFKADADKYRQVIKEIF